MKFSFLNNATTLVDIDSCSSLLIDPWTIGKPYQGSWLPSMPDTLKSKGLAGKQLSLFISHIHQDHWDIETIKLLDTRTTIYLPDMGINRVIERELRKYGFNDIVYIPLRTRFQFNGNIDAIIIPPLNTAGQDPSGYRNNSNDECWQAIDTGLAIVDKEQDCVHIVLCDNSPYNLELLMNVMHEFSNVQRIGIIAFPYNGYAQSYPLTYENLSIKQKKQISEKHNSKRLSAVRRVVELLEPDLMIPHSSDFYLRGPYANDFLRVHSAKSLDRHQFVRANKSLIENVKTSLIALDSSHTLDYVYAAPTISSTSQSEPSCMKGSCHLEADKLDIPTTDALEFEPSLIKKCYESFMIRAQKRQFDLSSRISYLFGVVEKNIVYKLDLWDECITAINGTLKDPVSIRESFDFSVEYAIGYESNEPVMIAILENKIHISNALIGCYLTTFRSSDEFNSNAYYMQNFFHV